MKRVRWHQTAEIFTTACDLLPAEIRSRIETVDLLIGGDPVFVGLHDYTLTTDGRSYSSTAHVVYEYHQEHLSRSDRAVTVVLPERDLSVAAVTHEIGHVLDWTMGFAHQARPITEYAETNRSEAFAEAFAAWALPFGHGYGHAKDRLYIEDRETVALFEALAS